MYFDSLTIVSMAIFAVAFSSFVYACLIRSCITNRGATARDERNRGSQGPQRRNGGE